MRCHKMWAMNDQVRGFIEWDGEFEDLYENILPAIKGSQNRDKTHCPQITVFVPYAAGYTTLTHAVKGKYADVEKKPHTKQQKLFKILKT